MKSFIALLFVCSDTYSAVCSTLESVEIKKIFGFILDLEC